MGKPDPKPQRGGARPGAGRPRTRPDGARKVQVVLSPAAAAAWAEREGDRSAWVSGLIEQASTRPDYPRLGAHSGTTTQTLDANGRTVSWLSWQSGVKVNGSD